MATRLHPTSEDLEETHDINVTPFIDIMLVLLIVFMIAAPLATVDIAVDLPQTNAAPQPRPDTPIYLTIDKTLALSLGDTPVAPGTLVTALGAASRGDTDTRIFLRADRTVPYGAVMTVMNDLRGAGYLQLALVALDAGERPETAP